MRKCRAHDVHKLTDVQDAAFYAVRTTREIQADVDAGQKLLPIHIGSVIVKDFPGRIGRSSLKTDVMASDCSKHRNWFKGSSFIWQIGHPYVCRFIF